MTEASALAVRKELAPADLAVLDHAACNECPPLDRSLVAVLGCGTQVLVARVGPPLGEPRRIGGKTLQKASRSGSTALRRATGVHRCLLRETTRAAKPKDDTRSDDEKKKRRGHPGRNATPAHLPRVPVFNRVPPELRVCPNCGAMMTTVSHSSCFILNVIPAHVFVEERLDETIACPNDDTIVSASPPPQIVERGKLADTLIVEAVCDKFIEHLPIERQCTRFARAGVDVAPPTLGRSVAAAIDLLAPVARLIEEQTRAPGLLGTDATGIPVLDPGAPEGIRYGTIWAWTNARWVTFFYSPTGDSDSVKRFLGEDLARTVQCDGTSITSFLERIGGKRPGCWAHGRRRLVEAARAGDRIALEGVRIIARLFAVERESTSAGDNAEQRRDRRQRFSRPILDELRSWIDRQKTFVPPKTPLGKGLGYLDASAS
ncbi:MAG: IS66 family transposase [Myxococcota bacterium]|nr:IS66 family transposase [Myxococcota bacterium]